MTKLKNFRSALLRPCNLLILTLANVLIFAAACTRGDDPVKAPTPTLITSIETSTYDQAVVIWEAATSEQSSPDNLTYQVLWQVKGDKEVKDSGTPKPLLYIYTLTGLSEKTTYRVWIKVRDEAGNTAEYPAKEFTTPAKKEEPKPDPNTNLDTTHYIQLTTRKKVGETVALFISSDYKNTVWLDLNANGKYEKEIDALPTYTSFPEKATYTLKAQTFRIYGEIKYLLANENEFIAFSNSEQPRLRNLDIGGNQLAALTLENLPQLYELSIANNPLTAVKLNLPKLGILHASDIKTTLKTIDTQQLPNLIGLNIYYSNFETFNLSKNPALKLLVLSGVPITALDVSANINLNYVNIGLTRDGKGLTGTALTNFIKTLPARTAAEKGEIELRDAQKTEEVLKMLEAKNWKVK